MKKTYAQELLEKERYYFKRKISYSVQHEKNLKKTLKQITSAKAYKLWQKAAKIKRGMQLLIDPQTMLITAKYLKLLFSAKAPVSMRAVELSQQEKKYIELVPEIPQTQVYSDVSIIIPTFNGAEELPRLFKAIHAQQRIRNPEIIIIDSASTDNTKEIAEKNGAVFIKIKQDEFNHGETRNLAAQQAKGNYLIFTVQDEIPANRHTFADLLDILMTTPTVVAASTRQIPFPDADMFAQWQILNHLSALQLNNVNFTTTYHEEADFYQQPFLLKRKLALLDDVCCAVKKKEFFLLGGYRKTDFAEDVDLALRILTSGYSIGFLGTNGVIHSHTRPSHYFLKRSFADVNTLHDMFQEKIPSMFSSLDELMSVANKLYKENLASSSDLLQEYLQELPKKLDLHSFKNEEIIQAEEMYWELFTNVLNQALSLFENEISAEERKIFSQKLFSSLIGSQIALFMLDDKIIKPDKLVKKVHSLLLESV